MAVIMPLKLTSTAYHRVKTNEIRIIRIRHTSRKTQGY